MGRIESLPLLTFSVLYKTMMLSSLRRSDLQGAIDLISRTLPDVARLPQHAIRILAKNALKQAAKAVPPVPFDGESDEVPQRSVPSARGEEPTSPYMPIQPANSNDLLPAVRPKTPDASRNTIRKRRRMSRATYDGPSLDGMATHSYLVPRPRERLDDVGGIASILETIRELVEWPVVHRRLYEHLGVDPPRGILLRGPSGCGKSLLAHAIAGDLGISFFRVSGPEIVSGMSGESERKLRDLFAEAARMEPSIVFIDEIDAIASRREGASKEMERRIVSQLLSCVDSLSSRRTTAEDKVDDTDGSARAEHSESKIRDEEGSMAVETGQMEANEHGNQQRRPSIIVVAATNRPESLEPALRRAGRFDREIELGAPDEEGRAAILSKLCRNLKLGEDFDLKSLARRTAGYVGADLHLLTKEAGLASVRRIARRKRPEAPRGDVVMENIHSCTNGMNASNGTAPSDVAVNDLRLQEDSASVQGANNRNRETSRLARGATAMNEPTEPTEVVLNVSRKLSAMEIEHCTIDIRDFEEALQTIQPSALREGFATRPNVSWENIGALEGVREEMMMAIVEPIRRPEMFSSLGLHAPAGVLLYGPPGCGKTLLARAVASESGANFISVKGPELLSKYVGDSELAVRKVFARARSSTPCVIFFDELDALAPKRGGGGSESSGASERVVNMLLTEMDGFADRKQIFLVAATNRPDIIDPAMLRPGRLDKLIFVPLPDENGRVSILRTLLKGVSVGKDVEVETIATDKGCEGFSGADLQALIRTAGERALRERMKAATVDELTTIDPRHFEEALKIVLPSVSPADANLYRSMEGLLRKTRGHLKS